MVIMALLGDIMVINLGIDLIRPFPDLIMRYILAPKAKTQQHNSGQSGVGACTAVPIPCGHQPSYGRAMDMRRQPPSRDKCVDSDPTLPVRELHARTRSRVVSTKYPIMPTLCSNTGAGRLY